jgi:hypothetical protein
MMEYKEKKIILIKAEFVWPLEQFQSCNRGIIGIPKEKKEKTEEMFEITTNKNSKKLLADTKPEIQEF